MPKKKHHKYLPPKGNSHRHYDDGAKSITNEPKTLIRSLQNLKWLKT
jgi:hypothetical protein